MKFNKLNTYTRMKRPTIKSFREVLHKTGGNITKAAAAFGVNRGTLYNWMKENEAFMQALKDERGALVDECIVSARILALGIPERDDKGNFTGWLERPDGNMLRYLLSTLGKEEGFIESMDITTNGKEITLPRLSETDIEELKKINGIGNQE